MKKYTGLLFFILFLISYNNFAAKFTLQSPAFALNTMIPIQYTCYGDDKSPPLFWHHTPLKTRSLALIMDDPDALDGSWTHWVLFNIPATITKIDAGSPIPAGIAKGKNGWGGIDYRGPCPTLTAHRYVFKLYALDIILPLQDGATKDAVLQAMTEHVIGSSELVGLYQKLEPIIK